MANKQTILSPVHTSIQNKLEVKSLFILVGFFASGFKSYRKTVPLCLPGRTTWQGGHHPLAEDEEAVGRDLPATTLIRTLKVRTSA